MNRSWITASRISDEYENGIEEFLQFAKRNEIGVNNKYYCPCVNCVNVIRQDIELIREHVLCDGFLKSYTIGLKYLFKCFYLLYFFSNNVKKGFNRKYQ